MTVASVRRIAADLRPALLDELGLIPAIEWLAKDFEVRYGIPVHTVMPDDLEAAGQTATAVFRIVQEALNNVARHAEAHHVHIRLLAHRGENELSVSDDGRGWNGLIAPEQSKSFGLIGVRERARLIGGSVTTRHAPGRGFRLSVTFPSLSSHGDGRS